jgi:hypothetical protein
MYSFTLKFAVEGPQTSRALHQSAQPSEADNKQPISRTVTPNIAKDYAFHQSCGQLNQHESTMPWISQGATNEKNDICITS